MDPFEQLPPELIRQIIQHTADFVGVESLLSVSFPVNAVFQAYSHQMLDDLITSNPITTIPAIHKLVRNLALIHNPSVHCTSLDDYTRMTSDDEPGPLFAHADTAELPPLMIQIAAQIQRLACICLATMQRNFVSAVGRSPVESFTNDGGTLSGSDRAQRASEPFWWIEEYRVYWALWHLRHYSDLRQAAATRSGPLFNQNGNEKRHGGRWGWSAESVERLDAYAIWNEIHALRVEWIWAVSVVLADCGLQTTYGPPEHAQPEPTRTIWHFPDETPIPFFASWNLVPRPDTGAAVWCAPPVPDETPLTKAWSCHARRCDEPSGQTMMYRMFSDQLLRRRPAVWGMQDAQSYRRLGVLVWSMWRMYSVGLYPRNHREPIPVPGGGFLEPSQARGDYEELKSRWLVLIGKPPLQ